MLPRWTIAIALILLVWPFAAPGRADDTVVLRTVAGKFVRVVEDGSLKADLAIPGDASRFELRRLPGERFALKAANGRYLLPIDPWGRVLRAVSPVAEPGAAESLVQFKQQGNIVGLKAAQFADFVVFDAAVPGQPPAAGQPRPAEQLELFTCSDVPAAIQALLVVVVRGVIEQEVGAKEYDQSRTRKIEKWVELPSPALNNLAHKKRHRVLASEEQTRVTARLDAAPEFAVLQMPYLKGYAQSGTGMVLFSASAGLQFRGQVHYKMPNVISAGTNYQAAAKVALVGEMRFEKSGDKFSFNPAEVKQLALNLDLRDLSNDLANLGRERIEAEINAELRHNDVRIRQQANQAIAKSLSTQQFQHPLLKYLSLP